jgi:hypothetical protein
MDGSDLIKREGESTASRLQWPDGGAMAGKADTSRPVPIERETRRELTRVEEGGGDGSRTTWSSGWRMASNCNDAAMMRKRNQPGK